jgi:trigger factor
MGMGHFLPDLEAAFKGMKAGEEKKAVKVKFPKDYHSADFAGKTVPFDIKLHTVNEIDPTALTEAQIEQITGQKQDYKALRTQVKETIEANNNKQSEKEAMDEYTKALAKVVKAELPVSWIEREVGSRLARLKQEPQYQKDEAAFWQNMGKTENEYKKDLANDGERDLLIFLGLSEIVKTEKIELDKDEMGEAHHLAHKHLQNADDHTSDAHHAEMEKATLNLKIDKFLRAAIME